MDLKFNKEPPVKLTPKELDWWKWAVEGVESALDDDDFMRDNPDMVTLAGQIDDLKYRLAEQAYDMMEKATNLEQYRADKRILNSLNKKLEGFYKQSETK